MKIELDLTEREIELIGSYGVNIGNNEELAQLYSKLMNTIRIAQTQQSVTNATEEEALEFVRRKHIEIDKYRKELEKYVQNRSTND